MQLPKAHRLLSGGAGTRTPASVWFAQSGAWAATFKAHWLPWPCQLLGLLSMVAGGPLPLLGQGGALLLQ